MRIDESLYCHNIGYKDRIELANNIMKYQVRNLGGKHIQYNIKI